MNIAATALAALSLASAAGAAAAAAAPTSDMDYLKASRCRGIAAGLAVDAAGLDSYFKAEGRQRAPTIQSRADEEYARAKRQAHGEGKERLAAELAGPCLAYTGAAQTS